MADEVMIEEGLNPSYRAYLVWVGSKVIGSNKPFDGEDAVAHREAFEAGYAAAKGEAYVVDNDAEAPA